MLTELNLNKEKKRKQNKQTIVKVNIHPVITEMGKLRHKRG